MYIIIITNSNSHLQNRLYIIHVNNNIITYDFGNVLVIIMGSRERILNDLMLK